MYIAIEGVIGVGKTSLARLLQPVFSSDVLLEIFEQNPFLSNFYTDRKRYAFQTQIFFLLSRYRQQMDLIHSDLSQRTLISDYTFEKDAIFARINLTGDELATYNLVHEALAERIPKPDLIVYLKADTNIAMQRIASRDRSYERNMERDYIEALNQAYDAHFTRHPEKVLAIDSSRLDFVHQPKHLSQVANRIRGALGIPPYQPELPFQGDHSE